MTNATCELGTVLGHDGDECRAQRCSNGHVHCLVCGLLFGKTGGWVGPSTIDALRNVSRSRSTITPIESRLDNRFLLGFGPNMSGNLIYERPELFDLQADATIGRDFVAAEFADIPPKLVEVATNLSKLGYRVTGPKDMDGFTSHAMRTVVLCRGVKSDAPVPIVNGVKIELTYIV